jgi:hypothetical protein
MGFPSSYGPTVDLRSSFVAAMQATEPRDGEHPCRSPKCYPATKRESSRHDLRSRSVIDAGLHGRIGDQGRRLTGVDRFRLKRSNPQRKMERSCFRRPDRNDGADRLTLRVQRPEHSRRNATCHPEFLCRARDGFGLRDSSGHNPRGAASSGAHSLR